MKQEYENYTTEDQQVWKILYDQQAGQLLEYASGAHLAGMGLCNFNREIPRIDALNEILLAATGWQITIVPGLIDEHSFFKLLSEKKFPASTWLRKMVSLDYLEEPDMFHDVFGHAPLLTNPDFCKFLAALAAVALDFTGDAHAIELISRLYWYTVEFGLIMEKEELKIYGAGILSSRAETGYAINSGMPDRLPFDMEMILGTPFIKDAFQEQYFIIDSYKDLYENIGQLPVLLAKKCIV